MQEQPYGKIVPFEEPVPENWTTWQKGEVVKIKDCYFKLMGVNLPQQQIIFKAISEIEVLTEKEKELKNA